jgi:hypothetical protein
MLAISIAKQRQKYANCGVKVIYCGDLDKDDAVVSSTGLSTASGCKNLPPQVFFDRAVLTKNSKHSGMFKALPRPARFNSPTSHIRTLFKTSRLLQYGSVKNISKMSLWTGLRLSPGIGSLL